MLSRIAEVSTGMMVHTHYAERRLRAALPQRGAESAVQPERPPRPQRPIARIPHFVLPPRAPAPIESAEVLSKFEISPSDFLMLVPGFLSGNKLLYEVLACFRAVQARCPGARLLFAGEERVDEYPLSRRIAQIWPEGDGPRVTGYLEADELDVLLARADLSFILRFPSYGESSGLLPRAAMGGGRVITVDIGAYPEFSSPQVVPVAVGAGIVERLEAATLRAFEASRSEAEGHRTRRQQEEAARLHGLAPLALYPSLKAWLDECAKVSP
jgi:glycosyltransferase involved in cell wall biosynthesis